MMVSMGILAFRRRGISDECLWRFGSCVVLCALREGSGICRTATLLRLGFLLGCSLCCLGAMGRPLFLCCWGLSGMSTFRGIRTTNP